MFKKTTLAFAALLLTAGIARAAAPAVITYGGFLLDGGGSPVTAPTSLTFRFYAAATGGTALGSETIPVLPSSEGFFSAVIGAGYAAALGGPAFGDLFESPVFMSVQFPGEGEMSPRIQISSVPSAMSVDWSGITGRPQSSCSGATPFVTGIDPDGLVTCGAAPAGVVTSVGGAAPISVSSGAAPQISIAPCTTAGQILKWNGTAWACATDVDTDTNSGGTVTSVAAGSGLTGGTITGSGTIGIATGGVTSAMIADGTITFADWANVCTLNQIPKWNGSAWACAADVDTDTNSGGTITGVTAGSGLTGGGTSGAVTLSTFFGGSGTATSVARSDHNHTGLYYTQSELNAAGTINTATNPVDWTKLKGVPTGLADGIDADSGGTITGVTAGSGLTGGGTSGTVGLAASYAGSGGDLGVNMSLARSDHGHNALYYTEGELNTAGTINTATNPVDWTRLKGVPAGLADGLDANSGGTVTSVTAGSGLTGGIITGSGTIALDPAASPTFADLTLSGSLFAGRESIQSASVPISTSQPACTNFGGAVNCFYGYASVTCSTGKSLLGGGCFIAGTITSANIYGSYPSGNSWACYANSGDGSHNLYAHAICARIQ